MIKRFIIIAAAFMTAALGLQACQLDGIAMSNKVSNDLNYVLDELFGSENGVRAWGEAFSEYTLAPEEKLKAKDALLKWRSWELIGKAYFDTVRGKWVWDKEAYTNKDPKRSAVLFSTGCTYNLEIDFGERLVFVRCQAGVVGASGLTGASQSTVAVYSYGESTDLALKNVLRGHLKLDEFQANQLTEDLGHCLDSIFALGKGARLSYGEDTYFLTKKQSEIFRAAMDWPIWVLERAQETDTIQNYLGSRDDGLPNICRFSYSEIFNDYQIEFDMAHSVCMAVCSINSYSDNYMGKDLTRTAIYIVDEATNERVSKLLKAYLSLQKSE